MVPKAEIQFPPPLYLNHKFLFTLSWGAGLLDLRQGDRPDHHLHDGHGPAGQGQGGALHMG